MQIDFHHAVTYVVARFAGFAHEKASTIANAAQYVDDSVESGYVTFENGMRFYRQATAHPIVAASNLDNDSDAESWLPFHFLPANGGGAAGTTPNLPYLERLICRPNSLVAQRMVDVALADRGNPWGLHRLGILAHVFVDTWAHQGFIGLRDNLNEVTHPKDLNTGNPLDAAPPVLPPIGHGQALGYPDTPWLKWSYINGKGAQVNRDNPADFPIAANELCRVFQRWQETTPSGLTQAQLELITRNFRAFTDFDGDERHRKWLGSLRANTFGFGAVDLAYAGKNWKSQVLGDSYLRNVVAQIGGKYPYPTNIDFIKSDWKLFHDAARSQRHDVFMHVLPLFGIIEN